MIKKRFVSIWFTSLKADWFRVHFPKLAGTPFVLSAPRNGKLTVTACSQEAALLGAFEGMAPDDARSMIATLQVIEDKPDGWWQSLLQQIAHWCIRYSPAVATQPDGLLFDATGCAHLWNGEEQYLQTIKTKFNKLGYSVRLAMAGTIGAAWALSHFGPQNGCIIKSGEELAAILTLPPAALRLQPNVTDKMHQLGFYRIKDLIKISGSALRRRFGNELITRLAQALGSEDEIMEPVQAPVPYQERLAALEPLTTRTAIEIAIQKLLDTLCGRLSREQKGLRSVTLQCFRVDGIVISVQICTSRPSHNPQHLFSLFELKLETIEPGMGIEVFMLEAAPVEELTADQKKLWGGVNGLNSAALSELLDRIAVKTGEGHVHRYLPQEHYWPERSVKDTLSLQEERTTDWNQSEPWPLLLLLPEPVIVTAPVPDYPPMNFRYRGRLHKITKADGPIRIEQEWWITRGNHRDYYRVEDEQGQRYSLFRQGHYDPGKQNWFIHGFFA